jgi:hypothetical protein
LHVGLGNGVVGFKPFFWQTVLINLICTIHTLAKLEQPCM